MLKNSRYSSYTDNIMKYYIFSSVVSWYIKNNKL
jgi:hypothetical protein